MSSFNFGLLGYKESETSVRKHSIYYLLFETYTQEQLEKDGNLEVRLMRASNIYEILSNTETIIYFLYKNANVSNQIINNYLKTFIQILIITSFIVNTPGLLASTYVFNPTTGRIDAENGSTAEIAENLASNGLQFVDNFIDYLFSEINMSVEYGYKGGYFSQYIGTTLKIFLEKFDKISQFVNSHYISLFPSGSGKEVIVLGILYNHLNNYFDYFANPHIDPNIKLDFIQNMIIILFGTDELPRYLSQIEGYIHGIMISLEPTPLPQIIDVQYTIAWFTQKINETTSEPNLWNDVTRQQFNEHIQQKFSQLSNIPAIVFQELQTLYEKITTSFQIIRKFSNPTILAYAATKIDTSQITELIGALNTLNIPSVLQYGEKLLPLLNAIEEQIKKQQDLPGLQIIASSLPYDEKNEVIEEQLIIQFMNQVARSGGKNRKIKNIKINTKKTKKHYKKIIKKQGTKMIKKQHKQNKKTTRKTK